jgi:hypothetical protein
LTTTHKNSLKAETVHVVDMIPEYPETSPSGTAYCVQAQNLTSDEIRELHKNVSYFITKRLQNI